NGLTQCLTAAVSRSVASTSVEDHGVFHSPKTRTLDSIVNLMGPLKNDELATAGRDHFGHEGQRSETTVLVERRQNLVQRTNTHALTGAQSEAIGMSPKPELQRKPPHLERKYRGGCVRRQASDGYGSTAQTQHWSRSC